MHSMETRYVPLSDGQILSDASGCLIPQSLMSEAAKVKIIIDEIPKWNILN
jgi:hypothetical protein